MPRFFPFSLRQTQFIRFVSTLFIGATLIVGALGAPESARADEFSTLPPGDPIAVQLAVISSDVRPASLTRYEAALQTARVILDVQNREIGSTSRAQWRAIRSLCGSLKNELRQLGVDVEAARALAAKGLQARDGRETSGPASRPATAKTTPATKTGAIPSNRFLAPGLLAGARPAKGETAETAVELRLSPRLRVATEVGLPSPPNSLTAKAPFAAAGAQNSGLGSGANTLASQTALSYDLSHYLTLRAANSRLNWAGDTGAAGLNPLLGAPLFAGAQGASGTGGGVDLKLGAMKFSTEIERLRANTGTLANRIGGGASLSAFQDRLLVQMSLSRLLPTDKNTLTTTAAEVGASLDVSPRLSLNLKYQGLFAPTPTINASRVSGGVSLSF